jgi:hypothetical protein
METVAAMGRFSAPLGVKGRQASPDTSLLFTTAHHHTSFPIDRFLIRIVEIWYGGKRVASMAKEDTQRMFSDTGGKLIFDGWEYYPVGSVQNRWHNGDAAHRMSVARRRV